MTSLRNMAAIFQKEWGHYFNSPIAYVALCIWSLLFGVFFFVSFWYFLDQSMGGQAGMGGKLSLNEWVIRPVFQNMAVVSLFILPMLTMRLFAEEKRMGTLELLATAPLTNLQIILGKFLAALALYGVMVAVGLVNIGILWSYATTPPEWKPVAAAVLALLLMGASFISLGLFLSTLTANQIVAGVLGFGLALLLWVLAWFDTPTAGPALKVLAYLGVTTHTEEMMKGVIDLKDVVYYLSFTFFGLFLAHQSVESQRWRA